MAELLCRTMEYAVSTEVLQVPEKDLVASTTSTLPAGPNDMGATEPVSRTVLAETENSTRLAGKTIYRHARRCNPREEPDALARTSGSVRGPGETRVPTAMPRAKRAQLGESYLSGEHHQNRQCSFMCEKPSSVLHGSIQDPHDAVGI